MRHSTIGMTLKYSTTFDAELKRAWGMKIRTHKKHRASEYMAARVWPMSGRVKRIFGILQG